MPLPAVTLPLATAGATQSDFLRHKWTLLFVGDGACDARCRKALYDTRQIRIALDRDLTRVQRVFIATGICCDQEFLRREHPDLIVAHAGAAAAPLLDALAAAVATPPASGGTGRIYLIDPLGNLVTSYAPDAPAKGLLEDIKRLLRLSQIG